MRHNINGRQRALAIAAMIGASALIAVASLTAKALGNGAGGEALHPLQISFGRFVFALLILGPFGLWLRPSFAGAAWRTH
ncbi:MAG: EamA/RhaT family transporter, partial [Alphaproteobacteria bacterium]